MSRYNIFQGNRVISEVIEQTLFPEIKIPDEPEFDDPDRYPFCTEKIYFPAFFYMTQKYGIGKKPDPYKIAAEWDFERKEFIIRISMNSCFVEFLMFGPAKPYRGYSSMTPYRVKWNRERNRKKHLLIPEMMDDVDVLTKEQTRNQLTLWKKFCTENAVYEGMTQKEFTERKLDDKWMAVISEYNKAVIGVSYAEYDARYGREYRNRHTRRALRVFRSFLKELMQPISVRDVEFNILGRIEQ